MAKPELGTKRVCVACAARFYDLQKTPAICPKCGTEQPIEQPRVRRPVGNVMEDKRPKKPVVADDADPDVEVVEEDADEDVLEDTADLDEDEDPIAEGIDAEDPGD